MLNLGLYKGLSGQLLTESLLNVGTERKSNLLDSISGNIGCLTDYSFNNGVFGVAWALEWLAQNKYLDINTTETLEEVDDYSYNIAVHFTSTTNETVNDILDVLAYLQIRITKVSSKDLYYRFFPLIECHKLLVKKLCAISPRNIRSVNDLTTAATVLLRFSFLINGVIQEKTINDYVYPTVENIIDFVSNSECDHYYRESLVKLSLFALQFDNHCWRREFANALCFVDKANHVVHKNVDGYFLTDIIKNRLYRLNLGQLITGLKHGLSVETLCFLLINLKIENPMVKLTN